MKTLSYTEARNGLAGLIKVAETDREPISITRNGHSAVVLLLQEEYDAMVERPCICCRLRQIQREFAKGCRITKPVDSKNTPDAIDLVARSLRRLSSMAGDGPQDAIPDQ